MIPIREVELRDRAAIVDIIRRTDNLTEEERDCAVELLDIYLKDPSEDDYLFLAAVEEGLVGELPVGYVCYGAASLSDGAYDLYWILVDPAHRGKGVGGGLLTRTEEMVSAEGGRMLMAETSSLPAYEEARGFYLKNGFREEARIKGFFKPGDDKLIYVKDL
ncbi:MAG: GNAT family N-acetyltransferase [Thermodesulfobacteriota bacterium]